MRILYLHQYFTTPDMSGGTRSYEMARRLVANGNEVHMITSSRERNTERKKWVEDIIEGIHVHWISIPYSNKMGFRDRILAFLRFSWSASRKAKQIGGDIVFATSTPLTIAIPGLFLVKRLSIPMVFEVRDLWPELPIAVGALRNPLAKRLARWLERTAYHASAHVVALSPGMAAGVLKCGIPPSKVSVIPNSCDTNLFDVPAEQGQWVRKRLGLKPGQPLIVYTGAFGLINGVGYLVDVAAEMRSIANDVQFLLVGQGAELEKVTNQAQQFGVLKQNLWIWPPLSKAKVPDLLAAATVATSVFVPLKPMWNNSANKFFDALAAGKPIAINYGGWQAELLKENEAGLVLPPDNPKSAAKLLVDFVRDQERIQKASTASRRLAYREFNRDLLYAKLEKVLRDVAEKKE